MFNIIASIVLTISLAVILVIFIRKQKNLKTLFKKENNSLLEETEKEIGQLEVLDKKINSFLEFFLRKIRTLLLKGDNIVSKWIGSLKNNKNNQLQEIFFIEEEIESEDEKISAKETIVEIKQVKKTNKKNNK